MHMWCDMWMMCEARSRQFEVWQEKTKMFPRRSKPIMLITCWYLCFPVSWALWFAILCCCLVSCRSASLDFLYDSFTHALPLLSFPVLSAFTLIPSTISHLWNQPCRTCLWYAVVVLTLLRSFIKRDGSTHTHIYIYIHTNSSSESACHHQD